MANALGHGEGEYGRDPENSLPAELSRRNVLLHEYRQTTRASPTAILPEAGRSRPRSGKVHAPTIRRSARGSSSASRSCGRAVPHRLNAHHHEKVGRQRLTRRGLGRPQGHPLGRARHLRGGDRLRRRFGDFDRPYSKGLTSTGGHAEIKAAAPARTSIRECGFGGLSFLRVPAPLLGRKDPARRSVQPALTADDSAGRGPARPTPRPALHAHHRHAANATGGVYPGGVVDSRSGATRSRHAVAHRGRGARLLREGRAAAVGRFLRAEGAGAPVMELEHAGLLARP